MALTRTGSGLYSFDPAQISVIIGGVEMSGFSDGTFVEVSVDGNDWEIISGADGDIVRAKKQNRVSTLSLTLLQSSPCNDILSAWRVLDKATMSGAVAAQIKDRSGSTLINADYSFIMQPATVTFSDGVETRTWNITLIDASVAAATFFVGGNNQNSSVGGMTSTQPVGEDVPSGLWDKGLAGSPNIDGHSAKTMAEVLAMLGSNAQIL
jgi:hypothetical protein